jgi:hypothetical protein
VSMGTREGQEMVNRRRLSSAEGDKQPRIRSVLVWLLESYFEGINAIYGPYAEVSVAHATIDPASPRSESFG